MFKNVGKSIKGIVKYIFVIESIISIVAGIVILYRTDIYENNISELLFISAVVIVFGFIGPFISWLTCLILYGYGEIVDQIKEFTENINKDIRENI